MSLGMIINFVTKCFLRVILLTLLLYHKKTIKSILNMFVFKKYKSNYYAYIKETA